MMKVPEFSLRFKIVATLATLLLATTAGVAEISSQPFIEEHQNLILELNAQYSARTVGEIQDYLEEVASHLAEYGRDINLRTHLDSDSNLIFVALLSQSGPAEFRPERSLSSPAVSATIGQSLQAFTPYFSLAATGSPQFFSASVGGLENALVIAVPFHEENQEMRGRVLMGILSSAAILDLIGESEESSRFLVNSRGMLLAQSGISGLLAGSDISGRDSVQAFLNRKLNNGQLRGVGRDRKPVLSSFHTIGSTGLGLVTEVPESAVFGTVKRVQYRALLVAITIFCLAFLIGTYYSETITTPIFELVKATELVKKGQFEITIKNRRRDEIAQLSNAFVAMAADLKAQQETLINQERLVVAGRLARNIGHEFGNVLQPLLTKLELLQEELTESGENRQVNMVLEMIETATLGAGICQGLMTLSKETQTAVVLRPFHLAEAVRKSLRLISHELKKKDIQLETDVAEDFQIVGNESQIVQVLVNLAVNAVHAMEDGGRLHIKGQRVGTRIELKVSDNGSGIAPENLKKIFEPLFSTKGSRGNGLGLSISKSIVESHGGKVSVESKPGEGTSFSLDFPLAKPVRVAA